MMDVTTPRVLTIRSAYDDAAKEVTLTIADSGPGIPEEIQSRIFEPFFPTKDIGEGTGVGLAVSHRIVEAHEGRIRVDSARPEERRVGKQCVSPGTSRWRRN